MKSGLLKPVYKEEFNISGRTHFTGRNSIFAVDNPTPLEAQLPLKDTPDIDAVLDEIKYQVSILAKP